jgi:hypothetical protein
VIPVLASHGSTDVFPFRKGVLWLLLALVTEVPPVVSLKNFSVITFAHLHFMYQVFIILNLNGNYSQPG